MPPKKKNACNDFTFYMQDQKAVLRREGRAWSNMEELVQICSPRWKLVSEKDRAYYKNMTKEAKERSKLANKYDPVGRSLVSINNERLAQEEWRKDMLNHVQTVVKENFQAGTLAQEKFYFLHMNFICEIENREFIPGEVSLAEFSLEHGVSRILSTFLTPWSVPLGYGYAIKKTAEDTHKMTTDIAPFETRLAQDYQWTFKAISLFLCKNTDFDNLPPLYTLAEQIPKVEWALREWKKHARVDKEITWKIYPIDELYFTMSQVMESLASKITHPSVAKDRLNQDAFIYSGETACSFHTRVDCNQYCSQFLVQKWAFVISEHCCDHFDIELIPGAHLPLDLLPRFQETEFHRPEEFPLVMGEVDNYDPEPKENLHQRPSHVRVTKSTPAGIHNFPPNLDELNLTGEVTPTKAFLHQAEADASWSHVPKRGTRASVADFPDLVSVASTEGSGSGRSRGSPRGQATFWNDFSSHPERPPPMDDDGSFPSLGAARGRAHPSGPRGPSISHRGQRARGGPGRGYY